MGPRSRSMTFVAVGTAGLLAVAACGSSSKKASTTNTTNASPGTTTPKYAPIPAGATIKLGLSVPLSGPLAQIGTTTQKAFNDVTLKTFNAAHPDGIDGHKVELEMLDDGGDVTKAVNAANQMVSDKVMAVIAATTNPAGTAQQLAVLNKSKIPVLTQLLNDDYTDVSKWPYVFSMGASNLQTGQVAADWIAKHPEIKKVATLNDGIAQATEEMNDVIAAVKKSSPAVQVAKQVTVSPGTTDLSTAVAQLKDSGPDLLMTFLSFGYGPLWQAIQTAGWTPKIMAPPIFYDGFTAAGNLAANMYPLTAHCVKDGHAPFPKTATDPMDGYATVFGTSSVNYLLFAVSNNGPLELLKLAIEKYHSTDPDAIKSALESMGSQKVLGTVDYNFSATNHFGLTGDLGPAVCKATGFSDGPYRSPVVAS